MRISKSDLQCFFSDMCTAFCDYIETTWDEEIKDCLKTLKDFYYIGTDLKIFKDNMPWCDLREELRTMRIQYQDGSIDLFNSIVACNNAIGNRMTNGARATWSTDRDEVMDKEASEAMKDIEEDEICVSQAGQ